MLASLVSLAMVVCAASAVPEDLAAVAPAQPQDTPLWVDPADDNCQSACEAVCTLATMAVVYGLGRVVLARGAWVATRNAALLLVRPFAPVARWLARPARPAQKPVPAAGKARVLPRVTFTAST